MLAQRQSRQSVKVPLAPRPRDKRKSHGRTAERVAYQAGYVRRAPIDVKHLLAGDPQQTELSLMSNPSFYRQPLQINPKSPWPLCKARFTGIRSCVSCIRFAQRKRMRSNAVLSFVPTLSPVEALFIPLAPVTVRSARLKRSSGQAASPV